MKESASRGGESRKCCVNEHRKKKSATFAGKREKSESSRSSPLFRI